MALGLVRGAQASGQSPTGITISPAFQQVSVQATDSQQPADFSITNDKAVPQTLILSVADFNTLGESGGLFFVGTNPTQLQKKYGLAKWISLPESQVTIPAKQTITLRAEILNLPTLAAGGHYGALMLALENGAAGSSPNNIGVNPIASSLLFVTKLGGDTHNLSLANVYFSHTIFSLSGTVTLRFQNNGNTHLIPRGLVTITDGRGKLVSKGIVNEDSDIILPQTFRRYQVPLNSISPARWPGRYKLTVQYRFDGYSQFRTYQASFQLMTASFLLVSAAVLLAIVGGLYALFRKISRAKTRKPTNYESTSKLKRIKIDIK